MAAANVAAASLFGADSRLCSADILAPPEVRARIEVAVLNFLAALASPSSPAISVLPLEPDEEKIDCSILGASGHAITGDLNLLSKLNLSLDARYIIVVEKDAIFQRLAEDRLYNQLPCILITAKGYPDIATRFILHRLSQTFPNMPIFALVDWNPAGLAIMCTYKYGSISMGLESYRYACNVKWLGMRGDDLQLIPESAFQVLKSRDLQIAKSLLSSKFLQESHRAELTLMVERGKRADIEALYSHGFDYLGKYVTRKIVQGTMDRPRIRRMLCCGGVSMSMSCSDVVTICGLFAVQCIYGLYMMFLSALLAAGVPSLFIIVVACAASSVVVLPFALALERKKWPKVWSPMLVVQLIIISLGGVSIYQVIMMLGVARTSPAIASAMPNLCPGFIFVIAACLGFERFDWKCKYTRAKILGTLVCLSGAMCVSFLKNPSPSISPKSVPDDDEELSNGKGRHDWILGCFCLLIGVIIFACNTVIQAAALKRFPAPLSICSITAMMGSIFSAIVQVLMEGKLTVGTADNLTRIIGDIVLVGGVVIGLCTAFQVSSIGRKGPVLVSIFNPFQTVFLAFISFIFFGQWIGLGCFVGIVLMFVGLYWVLWAKNREENMFADLTAPSETGCDIESSLLQ